MPCLAESLGDANADSLIGAVDYLGFSDLASCLACSQRLLGHGASPLLWDSASWRMKELEGRIPAHARWRPAEDPELARQPGPWKHLRAAASTWHFSKGLELYEQKSFEEAEGHLRALIRLLPGRPLAICRLADTLYGRAVSLLTVRQPEQSSRDSSSSTTPLPAVIDGGTQEEEEEEPNPAMFLSRSPMSPSSRPPLATVVAEPGEETNRSERRDEGYHGDQVQRPGPALEPQPPEQGEGVGSRNDSDDADRLPRPVEGEEAEDSASRIEALRERLLLEAKELYRQAYRQCPDCSYAVNGLTLFVHVRSEKMELLERAIELDSENPYALANLGAELFGEDDQRALGLLEKALQINPRLFYARLCKSKVLLRLGNLPAAVDPARSQLEWQPNDAMAERFLSQLEFRLEVVRRRMLLL